MNKLSGGRKKCVQLLLVAFALLFIFSNSFPDMEQSEEKSRIVMRIIEPILELIVGEGNVTLHLVRKLAHFAEFGVFGFMLGIIMKKPSSGVFLFALLAALTDETIQIFTGRGSQVKDVWLDFTGACAGITAGIFLLFIIRKIKENKQGGIPQTGDADMHKNTTDEEA